MMRPNFNSQLKLDHNDTRVDAEGPLNWSPNGSGSDVRCTVEVWITQIIDGAPVVAHGQSHDYNGGDPDWDARAQTDGTALREGTAAAKGLARPTVGEPYLWTDTVELKHNV